MTLDEIKNEWSKDCEIDDIELDRSSLEVPKLHAKYTDMLTDKLLTLQSLNLKMSTLQKNKWLWYTGKIDQNTLEHLGWGDDPFDGLKILKGDYKTFLDADNDVQQMKSKIFYIETTIDYLKGCIENIKWRHQTIKNTIEWRKFMAGQ